MKVIGIIAEYNPFHNGHAYQIKKIKEDLNADYVVVAMSGNFVQRGAPAIIDKYARTQMALSCGADLVIELPVLWATASAEYFAMAGVTLFEKMGCVDGICFGAETDDLPLLSMIAEILADEPENYRNALSSCLKEGFAFPLARCKALCSYLSTATHTLTSLASLSSNAEDALKKISSILDTPNNILAIEYLKALKRRNSSIQPYVIKREGAGYHEDSILSSDDVTVAVPTASATAIRKALLDSQRAFYPANDTSCTETLATAMPKEALDILQDYLTTGPLIFSNDFSPTLCYKLLSIDADTLATIGDSNPDLANRILKKISKFTSFEQYCELCKSKDITYTRLSRIFTHLILEITDADYSLGKAQDYIPYLRVLGFKKDSGALLKALKNSTKVPVISKLADASHFLCKEAMVLLEKDIFAADLYARICAIITETVFGNELTRNIIIMGCSD